MRHFMRGFRDAVEFGFYAMFTLVLALAAIASAAVACLMIIGFILTFIH